MAHEKAKIARQPLIPKVILALRYYYMIEFRVVAARQPPVLVVVVVGEDGVHVVGAAAGQPRGRVLGRRREPVALQLRGVRAHHHRHAVDCRAGKTEQSGGWGRDYFEVEE